MSETILHSVNEVCFFASSERVYLHGFDDLPESIKNKVISALKAEQVFLEKTEEGISFPLFHTNENQIPLNLAQLIGSLLKEVAPHLVNRVSYPSGTQTKNRIPTRIFEKEIDFDAIHAKAISLAKHVQSHREFIIQVLLSYETYEVANDEIERSLDLLENLNENSKYFEREVGDIISFLPKNQPLYAFISFVLVPSLMSRSVHMRIPSAMRGFFEKLMALLPLRDKFPNIHISRNSRKEFMDLATELDPDVIIFTGTMTNADRVRSQFSKRLLMISNGAGHNPIVIAEGADLDHALDGVLKVQLYNQGQDCAGPNAILVHEANHGQFMERLRASIKGIKIGPYEDREVRVGPITSSSDLLRVSQLIHLNRTYLDPSTQGIIRMRDGIVEPTIICRDLKEGGNYSESFAPIFFIHPYKNDEELSCYFQTPQYAQHAMYVTLYGESPFVDSLGTTQFSDGRPTHGVDNIIRNTNLHAPGIERGVNPYGGYGRGASCVSIGGVITPKPTLIPREIHEKLIISKR